MLVLYTACICRNLQSSKTDLDKMVLRQGLIWIEIVGLQCLFQFWTILQHVCVQLLNRVSVSRAIKPFAEPGRPPDWFSQKVWQNPNSLCCRTQT